MIDARSVLPNGVAIDGPVELRTQLASRPAMFAQALTEKLMMYALNRELEYFDMPQVRGVVRAAAKDNYKFSSIVRGIVNTEAFRKQGAPPQGQRPDSGDSMFITKKHISRRTLLKGAGVSLALPLLDAMVPAATALAQTAAAPKMRAGFFYIPHGAIMHNTAHGPAMDRWTPSGAGADFKLSPILSPLEPYKKYVTSFGNLENAGQRGFGSHAQSRNVAQRDASDRDRLPPAHGADASIR